MSAYSAVRYITSATGVSQAPPDNGREVAFAGRSNAGKSSVLNALTRQRSLARTSKTPGRTQMINFFEVNADARLVDLPGYGYAKVPKAVKQRWERELADYLETRQSLQGLILLMDVRNPLKEFDQQMLRWTLTAGLPVHILLNKSDKLKRGPAKTTLLQVGKTLTELHPEATVQLFSAMTRDGLEQLEGVMNAWLDLDAPTSA